MDITAAEFQVLAHTLEQHELAGPDTITTVVPLHQRSLCYRVDLADRRSLFVKQARATASGGWSADVVAEGRRLQALSAQLPAADFFPRVLLTDPERRLLVTTCYPDHAHLDPFGRPDRLREHLRLLGGHLAAVHAINRPVDPVEGLAPATGAESLMTALLWPTPTDIASFPAGYTEVLTAIRARGLAEPLTDLTRAPGRQVLVHGDLKSNNILCAPPDSVRLVDWETAGWGDPRWDLGAVIGDAVFTWLTGVSFSGPGGLPGWLAGARRPLAELRLDLAAFRAGYLAAGGLDPIEARADRVVCLGLAAAFLLQRTMASAMQAAVLPPLALAALQLAGQFLLHPDDAGEVLL